jgi:hypothetical protein
MEENRMIRLMGLCLAACALCLTPVAADEDVYDGPTAIKPLTVTPQHSVPPNSVCDFQHQCYPEKGGPMGSAPAAPPIVAVKPIAPPRPVANSSADDSLVATWRDCVDQALENYEQSHDLHALQATTTNCQLQLEPQGGANFAGVDPSVPLMEPPHPRGRRNIGCGWWPVGSDADRDCAAGGRRY